ncbi:MAG: hypothetical protein WCG95_06440 [bacterium]
MIRKQTKLFAILIFPLFIYGCSNQYLTGSGAGQEFYGAFRSVDFTHSDIQLYNTKTDQKCAGTLYIDNAKKAIKDDNGVKWVDAQANLTCNDGTLLDLSWKARTLTNWNGEGYDQYNRKYEFQVITNKQYKKLENSHKITSKSYEHLIKELVKY